MEDRPLMKCGHIANATTAAGKPCCVICECKEISDTKIVLTNRQMRCSDCGQIQPSRADAPFFKYCPDSSFDKYYCGCWGWN